MLCLSKCGCSLGLVGKTCSKAFLNYWVFGEGQRLTGFVRAGFVTIVARMVHRYPYPSADMAAFREHFGGAWHIVVLTGAGVSEESGLPTFRRTPGYWRQLQVQDLSTPAAFRENPSLVWEFYHYCREVVQSAQPNRVHLAIAQCEARLAKQGRRVVVITQNIDGLQKRAGSKNVLEVHGNLYSTFCTQCGDVSVNENNPICPALAGKGSPDPNTPDAKIPVEDLPRCQKLWCSGLLRPHVVWLGEPLDPGVMSLVDKELAYCDLCLVVGTSSVVYPAALFAPVVAARGVPVAEFNTEATAITNTLGFHFQGPAGKTVPVALAPFEFEES